jgi:hypothetical protein
MLKAHLIFMCNGPLLRPVIFSYVKMADAPTVYDIVVRYVPENVTSATEDHLYNEQLAVFREDNPQTPSDFIIEQSGLSISVTY